MRDWRYLAGRIVQYAIVLAVAISINFLLPRMMPGDPLTLIARHGQGRRLGRPPHRR